MIIDDGDFERLKSRGDEVYATMTYKAFLIWNVNCISELDQFDEIMLRKICERIQNCKLLLVDLEHCTKYPASGFYFNKDKKLCIVNF
jgi:hypothetical protein